jgi:AcrR family transcriptional regulator
MAAGRPRSFDMTHALDGAMDVFWRKGYEGASLVDLTTAMGINSPSLYAAFGSKEGLFRAVLDHYDKTRAGFLNHVLEADTAREAAERFLFGLVDKATAPENPPGCLLIQSGTSCGGESSTIPEVVARHRAGAELALRERFECAKSSDDLPKDTDAAALARYLMAISNGMCVHAAAGASRKELQQTAELALAAWPVKQTRKTRKKAARPRERVG